MQFVISRRLAELPVSREQWNALVAESPGATIFQTYEWFECWWTAFGRDRQLFLLTAWDGDAVAGIAPLMIERRAGLRHLEFVGSLNADYQDFILGRRGDQLLAEFARYLFRQRDAWDMMVLRNVPMDSATVRLFPDEMRVLGLGSTDQERVACPTLHIAGRTAEIRRLVDGYGFRRRVRRLQQHGELKFVRCSSPEQVNHYLPLFFDQYVERRRGSRAAEAFMRPNVRAFYLALAEAMLPRGWLHFSVLECADRPAAFHFGFEFGGRLYWYKPSFDPKLAQQSPGTVLLSYLIRDAVQSGLDELDFTVGAEPFKYRYASTQRVNANIRVFSRRWLYVAAKAVAWARRAASRLRHQFRATDHSAVSGTRTMG